MSTTHGNGTQSRLDRLLAYHESAAEAIRTTIGLLNGSAKAAKTNGHSTVLAEAIALDGARAHKAKASHAKKKKTAMTRTTIRAQRERTAQVLDLFDPKTPRAAAEVAQHLGLSYMQIGLGPLVHRKYLKRKGDGYVRTAKAYHVDKGVPAEA